jgi:hypothetical protein
MIQDIDYYSPFQTPWWLEAVAPGGWGEVRVEAGGALAARWPYVIKKRFGCNFLLMPRLTQSLGPWLRPVEGKYVNQISVQRKLLEELLDKLPHFDFFFQNFHFALTDWLPLHWRGFRQTTGYTYVLDDVSNLEDIWKNMTDKTRNVIRKAEKNGLTVVESDDLETFLRLNEMTFARQKMPLPFSQDLVRRIDAACRAQSAGKLFLAYDRDGRAHCGLYLVYDTKAAYYLLGGIDPELKDRQGMALTVWESIKYAATVTKAYDFEGSMQEAIERFVRGFGPVQKPYHSILKCNSSLVKMAFGLRTWLGNPRFLTKLLS